VIERLTLRARRAVEHARDEAVALRHNYIGTEHLLMGLLHEKDGIAARVLRSRNVDLNGARAWVLENVGRGDEGRAGQMAFTQRAKRVIERSLREARPLGQDWIDTEHILLALALEKDGLAARMLGDLGASPAEVGEDVLRLAGGGGAP
jgi:ATP-dependent Clp protease ATP-binding subunit ClpC